MNFTFYFTLQPHLGLYDDLSVNYAKVNKSAIIDSYLISI